jgi:predicted RNase H-like HicB family nuclease
VKGKAQQFTGDQNRIDELQAKANANRFTPPADGTIQEDRLVKFLEVRKRVYAIYEQHKDAFEAMRKKEKADFSDAARTFGFINDIRLAQAQAQADLGMSDDEYRFLVQQVYKTMFAAEVAKETGGKSVSEAAGETYEKASDQMKQAADEMKKAREDMKKAGVKDEAAQGASAEEAQESVEKSLKEMREAAKQQREQAKQLDVPKQNIDLFRKYEADIKKYAMSGLEWIGL